MKSITAAQGHHAVRVWTRWETDTHLKPGDKGTRPLVFEGLSPGQVDLMTAIFIRNGATLVEWRGVGRKEFKRYWSVEEETEDAAI